MTPSNLFLKHDISKTETIEEYVTRVFECPWCHVKPGERCIDVRVHRKRKMLSNRFAASEKIRSRQR